MSIYTKSELLKEIQNNTKLLRVFPLRTNQTLPDLALTTDINKSEKLIQEIGFERKRAFESRGIKVKGELDLDEHDLRRNNPYKSFFIWSQEQNKILASYRYFIPDLTSKPEDLAITEVFNLTDKYISEVFPSAIDLGRSFVIPELQSRRNIREGVIIFNNTYSILGKLYLLNNESMNSFTGKITHNIPKTEDELQAIRNTWIFLKTLEKENMLTPIEEYNPFVKKPTVHKHLKKELRKAYELHWKKFAPHLNSLIMTYYKTAKEKNEESKLIVFGTGKYPDNSTGYESIETAIQIKFSDFCEAKKKLYIEPHFNEWKQQEKISKNFDIYKGVK